MFLPVIDSPVLTQYQYVVAAPSTVTYHIPQLWGALPKEPINPAELGNDAKVLLEYFDLYETQE